MTRRRASETAAFVAVAFAAAALAPACRAPSAAEPRGAATPPAATSNAGGSSAAVPPAAAGGARLYDGLGDYRREISHASSEARRWFDQGLRLVYGFNHDEAVRSFREAARIDPGCPMAWWGVAYADGPHINNTEMKKTRAEDAWKATQEALRLVDRATPVEAALIRALPARYAWPAPENRKPLDREYAFAMSLVWKEFPNDADVGALYAEAMMDLQPWDFWTKDGKPKGGTEDIVRTLERVFDLSPRHPGANHFYIHAVEASSDPGRATKAADLLGPLLPAAGHLVHMPSHIYIRTGRYPDAADANERAIAADKAYFAVAPPPGFYSLYFLHNLHFLAYAAMMEGRRDVALAAARAMEREAPPEFLREFGHLADGVMPTTLHVMVRFGMWEDVLKEPDYPDYRLVSRTFRRYSRAVALSALGRTDEARAEAAAFDAAAARVPDTKWIIGNNPARLVLSVARAMIEGEIAFREGRADDAFGALRRAVDLEDSLVYYEPPGWMQPVRHSLGALLLSAGRTADAEAVYRADLVRNPNNGWALLGLEEALTRQGKPAAEIAAAARDRARAWARADVRPSSSCFCAPVVR